MHGLRGLHADRTQDRQMPADKSIKNRGFRQKEDFGGPGA
jgi:hypothetical protein